MIELAFALLVFCLIVFGALVSLALVILIIALAVIGSLWLDFKTSVKRRFKALRFGRGPRHV